MASAPTAALTTRLERLGGEVVHLLYELSVTAPEAQTWYLGEVGLDPDALYPGSPAYQPLILRASGILASAAIAGQGGTGVTLELRRDRGAAGPGGGPWRRWLDWFAIPRATSGQPYDPDTLSLTIKLAAEGLTSGDVLTLAANLRLQPGGLTVGTESDTLTFAEDRTLLKVLPEIFANPSDFDMLPSGSTGRPIPWVYGEDVMVPGILVEPATGKYVLCRTNRKTPGPINYTTAIHTFVLWTNPDSQRVEMHRYVPQPDATPTVENAPGADTWIALTEAARCVLLDQGKIGVSMEFRLRRTGGAGGAPSGTITLRIETDAENRPSGQLVHADAAVEFDASVVGTAGAWHVFPFPGPALPYLPPHHRLWAVLKWSPDSGSNGIDLSQETGGGTRAGWLLTRGEAREEWTGTSKFITLTPVLGLGGDGFLSRPPLFGLAAWGSLNWWVSAQLLAGSDRPGDVPTSYRAFCRFDLSAITSAGLTDARLRLHVEPSPLSTPNSTTTVEEIDDFGTLAASHWDQPVRASVGATGAIEDTWLAFDVTSRVVAAKAAGLGAIAFRWRTTQEGLDAGNQVVRVGSADAEHMKRGPRLVLTYTAGPDAYVRLHCLQKQGVVSENFNTDYATTRSGHLLHVFTFGGNVGDLQIAALMVGGFDNLAGNFAQGTSFAELIYDILRSRCEVPVGRLDTAGFQAAHDALATWFAPAGQVDQPAPASTWLARIAAAAKGLIYQDQDGKFTLWVDHRQAAPVRRVRPWEVGGLTVRRSDAGDDPVLARPWSRVDVYGGFDALGLMNHPRPLLHLSHLTEFNEYAVISADVTVPPDPDRQAQAALLKARYGERGNGPPGMTAAAAAPRPDIAVYPSLRPGQFGGGLRESFPQGGPMSGPPTMGSGITATGATRSPVGFPLPRGRAASPAAEPFFLPGQVLDASTFHFAPYGTHFLRAVRMLRDWLWLQNLTAPAVGDVLDVALPRFALGWRLMDEVEIESWDVPSEAAMALLGEPRLQVGTIEGGTVSLYSARRALCSVRQLAFDTAAPFPVTVTGRVIGWTTS